MQSFGGFLGTLFQEERNSPLLLLTSWDHRDALSRIVAVQVASAKVLLRRGRPPQPDAALLAEIRAIITELPTYGYRRAHALLPLQREATAPLAGIAYLPHEPAQWRHPDLP